GSADTSARPRSPGAPANSSSMATRNLLITITLVISFLLVSTKPVAGPFDVVTASSKACANPPPAGHDGCPPEKSLYKPCDTSTATGTRDGVLFTTLARRQKADASLFEVDRPHLRKTAWA